MITGLATHWCQVSDMARSVVFYRDVLGFSVGYQSEFWTAISVGGLNLGLHGAISEERPLGQINRGWVLSLATTSLDELATALGEAGVWCDSERHETPSGMTMMFADPDGNPIQAIQAHA